MSPPHILGALIEEAVSVGDLVKLFRLEHGRVALVEVTLLTVGRMPSMTRLSLAPSEPAAPGLASVSVASFPARSLIVPPLRASAVVER